MLIQYAQECKKAIEDGAPPPRLVVDEATLLSNTSVLASVIQSKGIWVNGEFYAIPHPQIIVLGNEVGYIGRKKLVDLTAFPTQRWLSYAKDFIRHQIISTTLPPKTDPVIADHIAETLTHCANVITETVTSQDISYGPREFKDFATSVIKHTPPLTTKEDIETHIITECLLSLCAQLQGQEFEKVAQKLLAQYAAIKPRIFAAINALPATVEAIKEARLAILTHPSTHKGHKHGIIIISQSAPPETKEITPEEYGTLGDRITKANTQSAPTVYSFKNAHNMDSALWEGKVNASLGNPDNPTVVVLHVSNPKWNMSPALRSRCLILSNPGLERLKSLERHLERAQASPVPPARTQEDPERPSKREEPSKPVPGSAAPTPRSERDQVLAPSVQPPKKVKLSPIQGPVSIIANPGEEEDPSDKETRPPKVLKHIQEQAKPVPYQKQKTSKQKNPSKPGEGKSSHDAKTACQEHASNVPNVDTKIITETGFIPPAYFTPVNGTEFNPSLTITSTRNPAPLKEVALTQITKSSATPGTPTFTYSITIPQDIKKGELYRFTASMSPAQTFTHIPDNVEVVQDPITGQFLFKLNSIKKDQKTLDFTIQYTPLPSVATKDKKALSINTTPQREFMKIDQDLGRHIERIIDELKINREGKTLDTVAKVLTYLESFSELPLDGKTDGLTQTEIYVQIIRQKKGVCRHLIALAELIFSTLKIPYVTITNETHTYMMFQTHDKEWFIFNPIYQTTRKRVEHTDQKPSLALVPGPNQSPQNGSGSAPKTHTITFDQATAPGQLYAIPTDILGTPHQNIAFPELPTGVEVFYNPKTEDFYFRASEPLTQLTLQTQVYTLTPFDLKPGNPLMPSTPNEALIKKDLNVNGYPLEFDPSNPDKLLRQLLILWRTGTLLTSDIQNVLEYLGVHFVKQQIEFQVLTQTNQWITIEGNKDWKKISDHALDILAENPEKPINPNVTLAVGGTQYDDLTYVEPAKSKTGRGALNEDSLYGGNGSDLISSRALQYKRKRIVVDKVTPEIYQFCEENGFGLTLRGNTPVSTLAGTTKYIENPKSIGLPTPAILCEPQGIIDAIKSEKPMDEREVYTLLRAFKAHPTPQQEEIVKATLPHLATRINSDNPVIRSLWHTYLKDTDQLTVVLEHMPAHTLNTYLGSEIKAFEDDFFAAFTNTKERQTVLENLLQETLRTSPSEYPTKESVIKKKWDHLFGKEPFKSTIDITLLLNTIIEKQIPIPFDTVWNMIKERVAQNPDVLKDYPLDKLLGHYMDHLSTILNTKTPDQKPVFSKAVVTEHLGYIIQLMRSSRTRLFRTQLTAEDLRSLCDFIEPSGLATLIEEGQYLLNESDIQNLFEKFNPKDLKPHIPRILEVCSWMQVYNILQLYDSSEAEPSWYTVLIKRQDLKLNPRELRFKGNISLNKCPGINATLHQLAFPVTTWENFTRLCSFENSTEANPLSSRTSEVIEQLPIKEVRRIIFPRESSPSYAFTQGISAPELAQIINRLIKEPEFTKEQERKKAKPPQTPYFSELGNVLQSCTEGDLKTVLRSLNQSAKDAIKKLSESKEEIIDTYLRQQLQRLLQEIEKEPQTPVTNTSPSEPKQPETSAQTPRPTLVRSTKPSPHLEDESAKAPPVQEAPPSRTDTVIQGKSIESLPPDQSPDTTTEAEKPQNPVTTSPELPEVLPEDKRMQYAQTFLNENMATLTNKRAKNYMKTKAELIELAKALTQENKDALSKQLKARQRLFNGVKKLRREIEAATNQRTDAELF
jgi:hypothetical protein